MRLTDEQIQERKNGLLEGKAILHGRRGEDMFDTLLDYIDTIEALQQENEQLQAQAARMKSNLCLLCIGCETEPENGEVECNSFVFRNKVE